MLKKRTAAPEDSCPFHRESRPMAKTRVVLCICLASRTIIGNFTPSCFQLKKKLLLYLQRAKARTRRTTKQRKQQHNNNSNNGATKYPSTLAISTQPFRVDIRSGDRIAQINTYRRKRSDPASKCKLSFHQVRER